MEENIKILEEIVDVYYDCAGNKEQDYDMRVDMGFMKKEAQSIENLIKGYRELEEENKKIIQGKFREVADKNSYIKDMYIPKSKIKEKIEEVNKSLGYSPVNKILIEQVLQQLLGR